MPQLNKRCWKNNLRAQQEGYILLIYVWMSGPTYILKTVQKWVSEEMLTTSQDFQRNLIIMNWNGAQWIAAASYSYMYTRSSRSSLLIMMGLAWPLDLVQVALVLSLYIAYTTLSLISNRFVKHCLVCWSKNKK